MLEISSWGQFNSIQYPVIVWLGNLDKLHMVHILDVALPAPIVVKVYQHIEAETNCRHFTDDIFKGIFLNADVLIALKISLKFVPNIRINNIPSLIKIMAWRRSGDKPLSESMMVILLTHTCETRPPWVKKCNRYRANKHIWLRAPFAPDAKYILYWRNVEMCHSHCLTTFCVFE